MSVTDKGCETVATVRDYTEITEYCLTLPAWIHGGSLDGLNADEVVETAHEYGTEIAYESLPTVAGDSVEVEGWRVTLPN